jgi:hypothetical protein
MTTDTIDRTVEILVERFGKVCSEEYSAKVDRSGPIIDYVMGKTDQMPDMVPYSNNYAYRTMDQLLKLSKKDDSDLLFRACALLLHTAGREMRKHSWIGSSFSVSMGDEAKVLGLAKASKLGQARVGHLTARLERLRHFAGDKAIEDELNSKVINCKLENKNRGSAYDIVDALFMLKLYAGLEQSNTHRMRAGRLTSALPELLQAVLNEDPEQLRQLLAAELEPLIVCQMPAKNNISKTALDPAYLAEKQQALKAARYPNSALNPKDQISANGLYRTMLLLSSALLYCINIHGGKEAFLAGTDETGKLVLDSIRALHEIYPLEIRNHLLELDGRAKQEQDQLLTGLLPLDEPYGLIDLLRTELNGYYVQWNTLQTALLSQQERALRAYGILNPPYQKAFIHKVLTDNGIEMLEGAGSVEQAVFAVLRHPLDGGRHGLALARCLNGETTPEDFWKEKENRSLFDHRNRDARRKSLLAAVSFLPVETAAFRRFAILITRPESETLNIVSELYFSYAFSGEAVLNVYGEDAEVNRDRLLSSLLKLNGMKSYEYKSMPQDEYKRIIEQHLGEAIGYYKDLPTDSRLAVLESLFAHRDSLSNEQLAEAIRAGLQDSSKKANAMALAEFSRVPDKELYMQLYRSEKKAAIKELVLGGVRSLADSKAVYLELLEGEKSPEWKSLIQILRDTADQSPSHAHIALADLADAKKTARLSWLSVQDLPNLTALDGTKLDDRIKQYILLQSLEHTTAPNTQLNELRSYANEESLALFAAELIQLWLHNGAPAKEKWVLFVGALFGDRALIRILGPQIKEWTENSRGAMAAEAVKVLAYLKEPAALMMIDTIKRTVKNRQVKGAAEEALELAAEHQGLTPEQLEDRLVTSLGFDDKGAQQLSYGERTFQVKVNRELEIIVLNEETGKPLKTLPAPSQKDDAELAAKSKAQFTQLKKDLKTMVGIQSLRLEESLSRQRLWTAEEWTELFVRNIIMQKFAVGLIWGIYEDGKLTDTFRYMEDGTFNTVDEEEFELPPAVSIGLIHPLELEQSTLNGWKSQLDDYEIKQPFAQLERDIYVVEAEDEQSVVYDRLPEEEFSPTAFPKALEKYGWYKGQAQDGGWYHEFYKEYGDWIVEFRFSGTSITYYEGLEQITLESLHFYKNKHDKYYYYSNNPGIVLGKVPGRVYSETIYDVMRAAGR